MKIKLLLQVFLPRLGRIGSLAQLGSTSVYQPSIQGDLHDDNLRW
jgi:hypothetical protein